MNNIASGYIPYQEELSPEDIDNVKGRYAWLHEQMSDFIESMNSRAGGISDLLYINETSLIHAVLEYYQDIQKVKLTHELEHANSAKVYAYLSYWILRRHPIQLVPQKEINDDLVYANEKFVLSFIVNFLVSGSEAQPLDEKDRGIYLAFINSFYYYLKFRRLDPQSLEMIILSFRLGGVFPRCKDVQ